MGDLATLRFGTIAIASWAGIAGRVISACVAFIDAGQTAHTWEVVAKVTALADVIGAFGAAPSASRAQVIYKHKAICAQTTDWIIFRRVAGKTVAWGAVEPNTCSKCARKKIAGLTDIAGGGIGAGLAVLRAREAAGGGQVEGRLAGEAGGSINARQARSWAGGTDVILTKKSSCCAIFSFLSRSYYVGW